MSQSPATLVRLTLPVNSISSLVKSRRASAARIYGGMSHYKARKTYFTEVELSTSSSRKLRQLRKMKKHMCVYGISGSQSDTDRGEPQGSVLRCELTNLFDITSSQQRGEKKMMPAPSPRSSNSIAHSLFMALIYVLFFMVSSISLTKSVTSSFFCPPPSIYISLSHSRSWQEIIFGNEGSTC